MTDNYGSTVRRPALVYLCVVAVTALLWLMVSLSERHPYRATFRISWTGVDTARYAVLQADKSVTFDIVSNGFLAFSRARLSRREPLVLDARRDTLLSPDACVAALQRQFSLSGVHGIRCREKQICLRLAERRAKAFVPQLTGVNVSFADPYALYGTISVEPDTVWLYGSEASLAQVERIGVKPATLANVRDTRSYQLALDPVWLNFPDLHVSSPVVSVTIPTARFTEKRFTLPLTLVGAPEGLSAHLYPGQVDVLMWVSEQDYSRLEDSQMQAQVLYAPGDETWKVIISSFPAYARIRSVTPETVRYVIIQS
ncbi:MAG: hypothetical protein AUK63_458 [bacterium P3]|nr:MAG: hypothetical protein AUK63_458 [bacterium P3]KWW41914.1 MAG: hypothetical protein F083_565 [bacterium F083]